MIKSLKSLLLGLDKRLERFDKKVSKPLKIALLLLTFVCLGLILLSYLHGHSLAVLSPKGPVAVKQRNLLAFAAALSLLVIIPVFVMTFWFAWKYRENNSKARYLPNRDHNRTAETVWWGVPLILVIILSIVTWNSSHTLDPFRPLDSSTPPLTIQVVALQWKWLFIYPDQRLATVNYVRIPEKTPINFEITADAPMNSFWVPQLGGQVYAMSGMSTQLHLMADQAGSFEGSSANISGEGFAGMHFTVQATTENEFNDWVLAKQQNPAYLDSNVYNKLSKPSLLKPQSDYRLISDNLYNGIVMKFMDPTMHDSPTDHQQSHARYGADQ